MTNLIWLFIETGTYNPLWRVRIVVTSASLILSVDVFNDKGYWLHFERIKTIIVMVSYFVQEYYVVFDSFCFYLIIVGCKL